LCNRKVDDRQRTSQHQNNRQHPGEYRPINKELSHGSGSPYILSHSPTRVSIKNNKITFLYLCDEYKKDNDKNSLAMLNE